MANANCEKSGGLVRSSLGLAASCEYRLSQVGEHLASFLNGKELVHKFTVDFYKENLGRSHIMRFGAYSLYDRPGSSTASR